MEYRISVLLYSTIFEASTLPYSKWLLYWVLGGNTIIGGKPPRNQLLGQLYSFSGYTDEGKKVCSACVNGRNSRTVSFGHPVLKKERIRAMQKTLASKTPLFLFLGIVLMLMMTDASAHGEEVSAAVAVPPPYLTVLTTPVTDANKNDVTGPGISGHISYDPASKTLTLDNVVLAGVSGFGSCIGIQSADELTVELIGSNRIGTMPADPSNPLDYDIFIGIASGVGVNLFGDGNLAIYDEDTGIFGYDYVTVYASIGTLTIVECGNSGRACCLKSEGEINLFGGTISLTSYHSNGICAPSVAILDPWLEIQTYDQDHVGLHAFCTAPVLASETAPQVFAGADAASAILIPQPVATTFTQSPYVRIEPAGEFTVTVVNGSGSGLYAEGATVFIEAVAAPAGKVFDGWVSDSDVVFANANNPDTTFVMPGQDVTVTAMYKDAAGVPATGDTTSLLGIVSLVSMLGLSVGFIARRW